MGTYDQKNQEVGLFSLVRWGVGGTIIVVVGAITASVLLGLWFKYHSLVAILLSALTYAVVIVVVFVKITEEIQPTRHIDDNVVGKTGVVVNQPTSSRPAVVKVGGQLWSAKSASNLAEGDLVVVIGREGIYLVVEKAQTTGVQIKQFFSAA